MTKLIAFSAVVLSSLMFVAGTAEAGCRSGGGWGWSRAPAYQYYYYPEAPSTAAQGGSTYRSYSYDPGAAQPRYQYYYAPRTYSAPRSSGSFPADAKIRGNVMGH